MSPSNTQFSPEEAASILAWHLSLGVDETVESTSQPKAGWAPYAAAESISFSEEPMAPRNLNDTAGSKSSSSSTFSSPASPSPAPQASATAIAQARMLADNANTIDELKAALMSFDGCMLKKTAMNTVFADGNPASRLMVIGEAPGAEEDKAGTPFCGASGMLLDTMLSYAGLVRAQHYTITNTIFWRPPGNRQPTQEEIDICRPFVEKHIALINPTHVLLLGGTATKALLGETRGVTKLRGNIFSYSNPYLPSLIPVHVTFHPSYLLRQPLAKREAWSDILAFYIASKPS